MANPTLLLEQLRLLQSDSDAFFEHRQELISLSRNAIVQLETPFEMFQRLAYSPLPLVAARIAQEHSIFSTLVSCQQEGIQLDELAQRTKLTPSVLVALLEYLVSQNMVKEVAPECFGPSKLSELLLAPLFVDGTTHFHDNCLPAFAALNRSLTGVDKRTAFEIGQHSDVDFYTWMETHPVQQGAFHRFMEAQFTSLPSWLDAIDFETEYGSNANPNTPLFVDVGGGAGQQIVALQKRYPALGGRFVLQDTPAVIQKAVVGDNVERMAYDYLTEQSINGARVYYFRQIFHNNDDATCEKILAAHHSALGTDSVILIDEKVLPDTKPPNESKEYTSGLSLAMLAMFKALERKEHEWRRLLDKTGYQIVRINRYTDFGDSVIIVTKK